MALTLTTEAEIAFRAGLGASTAITLSSAHMIAIGEAAEKEFIADTRRNWIVNYSDVNDNIKGKVSAAVAAKAARYIVEYDRTNYYSSAEHEVKIDSLIDAYNQAVQLLSDLDNNAIREVTT